MKIVTTRRISQTFFFIVFLWFCLVTTLGDHWWQLRGWPVNWIIELDPLVGLATLMSTRTLYAGLLWGVASVGLTIILGRFFCGWLCPFGTIHQFIGFAANRKKSVAARVRLNRWRPAQSVKYWILAFLLAVSALELALDFLRIPATHAGLAGFLIAAGLVFSAIYGLTGRKASLKKTVLFFLGSAFTWFLVSHLLKENQSSAAALQIGLLDPIPLVYRSFNLIVLPLIDHTSLKLSAVQRLYDGTWLIAAVFLTAVMLNLVIPRFYCRFICPAGALFAVLSRFSLWRIGKSKEDCFDCHLCEKNCEGACEPTAEIRSSECVLCVNCINDCRHGLMTYQNAPSASGEISATNLSRRQFLTATISGAAAIPLLRISGSAGSNWNPAVVRPPGALPEVDFLSRCIKCGQCMRICPTNVIHPAGLESGLEGLWTPLLNFRIGTSGCQQNCIACGHLCPTAAIRPISLDERLGRNRFADQGPIKIGTAFIDRGRCLPWAMDRPCIVCQENCPVSPKAISTREIYQTVIGDSNLIVAKADAHYLEFQTAGLGSAEYTTGDYYCALSPVPDSPRRRIVSNWERGLKVDDKTPFESPPSPGSRVLIQIRLQKPYVDPAECIGCGICQHECPVPGKRAIRVTADGESRDRDHALLLQR
ncbi:4Fe-4S ferredoxin iron-sulfur binding domain protein [Olavius algarvensis Delta 1 endosymbiont]|nr:4Fe-4S ferredoxin iron-sulfur binding domain protein [Olavius algarvensis Delta 1 endosymbiont]